MPIPTQKQIDDAVAILNQIGKVATVPYPDEKITFIILREKNG